MQLQGVVSMQLSVGVCSEGHRMVFQSAASCRAVLYKLSVLLLNPVSSCILLVRGGAVLLMLRRV